MSGHEQLFLHQMDSWPMAAGNYHALKDVLSKDFILDGIRIRLQCNPARLASTSADISTSAILQRPCFLCAENRPTEQTSLTVLSDEDFFILVNPFPIFQRHYTIAGNHQPQAIREHINLFLELSRSMNDCVVFYNGARCGASAPDHLHFQAGNKGLLPVETDFSTWKSAHSSPLICFKKTWIGPLNGFLRGGWLMEGTDEVVLSTLIEELLDVLGTVQSATENEPMLNLLSWYDNDKWTILLFPRKAHRPSCYNRPEPDRFLISPASVEMGGLIIAARPEDFERIQENTIREIYADVSFSDLEIERLSALLLVKQHIKKGVRELS